jgi:hypothetical protein
MAPTPLMPPAPLPKKESAEMKRADRPEAWADVLFGLRIGAIALMGWVILVVSRSMWRFGIAGDKLFIGFVALAIASSLGPYGPMGWQRCPYPFCISPGVRTSKWRMGRILTAVLFVPWAFCIMFMVQQVMSDIYRLSTIPPWVLAPIHWREAARMNLIFNFWGLLAAFWIFSLWSGADARDWRWEIKNGVALPLALGRLLMGWIARYIIMFPRGWRIDLLKFGLAPPLLMWLGAAVVLLVAGAIMAVAYVLLIALPGRVINQINRLGSANASAGNED